VSTVRVYWPARHIAVGLCGTRLWIIILSYPWEPILRILRLRRRQEIDDEAPDIENVDQRDDPLEDGADVVMADFLCDAEYYREGNFSQDEEEFDPEGDAQDAMLAEVDAKALVFGADEDG
jgi:hypothetical protein